MTRVARTLVAAGALALFAGGVGYAQQYDNFTFKSVKPPSGGGKRITVQITEPPAMPRKPDTPAETAAAPSQPELRPATYDWFWDNIAPDMTETGPWRLEPALQRLGNPPAGQNVSEPRLDDLLRITRAHGRDILLSTVGTRVSPALALAVIAIESSGRSDAVSGAGAMGLMQLMPETAERFGVTDRADATESIRGGVSYLDVLMKEFGGDPMLVLAGYNAGENAVKRNGGVPPYAETRDYVPKVLAAFRVARGLCMTPPELISDGCAFREP
ncbi:lytic transglycosylase domain-containing protein [Pseudooceanicola sp. C21-150M6]|uniref:lytic transglycosylase domain-containing protein n=1 Tax=Pseudooceanicola sp. C21-150M6 TaxID=3434355 RepID=UPI003D7FC116